MHVIDAPGSVDAKSASSSTMLADLPPSSRNTRFKLLAPRSVMRLPTADEPVNEIMSTSREPVSTSATSAGSDAVTTLNTPGGMSVSSATSLPIHVAENGVSGAGLSTTVQPAANAGVIFERFNMNGKFHGVIAPHTPMGSLIT